MNIIWIVIISAIGGAGLASLFWLIINLSRRVIALDKRLTNEENKRHSVESVNGLKNHYCYNTKAAAQDIAANTIDLEFDIAEMTARLQTIRTIANSISKDPSKYDPDRPSSNRS